MLYQISNYYMKNLFIAMLLIYSLALAKEDFYSIKNSQMIRDSLNSIKFVNPNTAIELSFSILENYSEKRPNRVIGSAYAALGQIYHIKGLSRQSLEYLSIAEKEFYDHLQYIPPWLQVDFGNVYFANGFYDKAIESYRQSYNNFNRYLKDPKINKFNRKQNFLSGLATSSNNIALVEIEKRKFKKAEERFLHGLKIRRQIANKNDISHSYLSLAELYYKWEKYELIPLMCDSSDIAIETQQNLDSATKFRYLGMSNQYRGLYYYSRDDIKKSLKYFSIAMEFYKSLPIEKTRLLALKSSILQEKGSTKEAIESINKAMLIADKQGLNREIQKLLNSKKEILYNINDLIGVQKINERIIEINKLQTAEQNKDLLLNLELKNDLIAGQALLEKQQTQRRFILAFSGLLFLILILMIISIRNQNLASIQAKTLAEQSKLVAELELKSTENELRNVSSSIIEKNEMIESIKKDVNYASQFLSNTDSKYLINPLKSKLHNAISGKSDWEEFKIHFNRAYPNFFDELAKINSTLTIQDLRLCAYLKSGQTTKEIAQLTGLSIRSIESRRYRLRKKLNLIRDISLFEFIQTINLDKHIKA